MPTYSDYLKLDRLLVLQEPGADHDEMLFIIIHQTYELWFKEILHELDHLRTLLTGDDLPRAGHVMKRVLTVLKVLVGQVDILETMTPLEFLSFRTRLEAGSGFQSAQFRELEFVLPRQAQSFPRLAEVVRQEAGGASLKRRQPGNSGGLKSIQPPFQSRQRIVRFAPGP